MWVHVRSLQKTLTITYSADQELDSRRGTQLIHLVHLASSTFDVQHLVQFPNSVTNYFNVEYVSSIHIHNIMR